MEFSKVETTDPSFVHFYAVFYQKDLPAIHRGFKLEGFGRTNYTNFNTSQRALSQELGAGIVRYPGGEMADSYLWSVPPFAKADPRIARAGPEEVPCWGERPESSSQ